MPLKVNPTTRQGPVIEIRFLFYLRKILQSSKNEVKCLSKSGMNNLQVRSFVYISSMPEFKITQNREHWVVKSDYFFQAPVLHGLPTSVNVGELEYKGRLIYELTVTDINQDSFVCNTRGVVPSPNNTNIYFRILIDSANGSKFGISHVCLNKVFVFQRTAFRKQKKINYLVPCIDSNYKQF